MTQPATIREYEVRAESAPLFGRVLASARQHHFVVDGPVQNGCPGEAIGPVELLLAGVAACAVELIQVIGRETGVAVRRVEARVRGSVDRARQPRTDVTVFTRVDVSLRLGGAAAAGAAALVEGFKRR